jgi:hypothetical protein
LSLAIIASGTKSLTLAWRLAILQPMLDALRMVAALRSALFTRLNVLVEILALRHQLGVLARSDRRFRPADRFLWLCLQRYWPRWRDALVLVKPTTVARWRRKKGFGNAGASGRGGGPEDHASMPTFAPSFGA